MAPTFVPVVRTVASKARPRNLDWSFCQVDKHDDGGVDSEDDGVGDGVEDEAGGHLSGHHTPLALPLVDDPRAGA